MASFMDSTVLRKSGVAPDNPRRAYVEGYRLRMGHRATLVPASGARLYGTVIAFTHSELEQLYSAPGLDQYRPEAASATLVGGGSIPALATGQ